ncbi:MAG TPA: hypothetical protein VJW23_15610 [Propionibacteriaceae bacterium]|jgi:hypothetical protein|nr:hypothetical protein [Propionibacteriaceae bacterium]
MVSADQSDGAPRDNLYGQLAEPAPATAAHGETTYTAAKETIDRDREDLEETLHPGES